nr:aryl-sulfate sulfotransferase [Thiorhodococcus mannitoliphagus]
MIGNPSTGLSPYPHATDLEGNLIWYLERAVWALRPSPNGTFWHITPNPETNTPNQLLTKADLLGNNLKQTNVTDLNMQLEQGGYADRINDIHHDVRELPNGDVAFIATVERLVTDLQGPGEVSVLGDMIIVTDGNLQIKWLWNGWDHLDPTRLATLGEVCSTGIAGCPPFYLADQTNDWMHANALAYTADGDFLLSVRHQDWVLKIDYDDGSGDGSILWRLGPDGDFARLGGSADDWFSHSHDPSYIADNRIILFDNSNLRCEAAAPPPDCQSRGQVWEIDEEAMTAELVFNQDLGEFAYAVGSAQQLSNGNYWLNSGILGTFMEPRTTIQELDPNGTAVLQTALNIPQYRSYRLRSLYASTEPWDRVTSEPRRPPHQQHRRGSAAALPGPSREERRRAVRPSP